MQKPRLYIEKPQPPFEALQLSWGGWDAMCDFVKVEGFRGVYLNENGAPLPDEETSDTMGALVPYKFGPVEYQIAQEGDFIAKLGEGEYYVIPEESFNNSFQRAINGVPSRYF